MSRPRLLDLFCGAGGAAVGYHRAGFEVVGVDIKPQPNYPFEFIQGDALTLPIWWLDYDAVHASPPCQHHAAVTQWRRKNWDGDATRHPEFIAPTRERLGYAGLPYVIENVREAQLQDPIVLCGSGFGLRVKRHRYFESNVLDFGLVTSCNHAGLLPFDHSSERAYADAMGCDWMTAREARQAIPPAYTEHIGEQLLSYLRFTNHQSTTSQGGS